MSSASDPNHPGSPPFPVEGTLAELAPPFVEGTGVQVGGPPASTQVRVHREQPEIPGYEFMKRLGKGGMGVVWLCKDKNSKRLVALKQTISDELTESERTRFRTEAQAMAKLRHPNVVQVYDVDEYDGRPYFTMEFCPGGSLHEFLDRKPQPPQVCAQIVEKLALGMQHAHDNGIIQRDLKPANVLVNAEFGLRNADSNANSDSENDSEARQRFFQSAFRNPNSAFLKITDFGLAKNLEASIQATGSLDVMGTPSYMAPEQGSSTKKAGLGADVWSLGVILYEAITGSLPFVGADRFETYLNACNLDPVPPSEKINCPKDLETICLKCLRKDPKDRYPTAQALADDLRAYLEDRSISARPMGRIERTFKWVKKNPGVAAMISLVAVTLFAATLISLSYANRSAKDADDAKKAFKKADDALKEAQAQQKRRALAQVETLLTADPRAVPSILKNLEEEREDVFGRLKEVWEQPKTPNDRLRVALALLPVETELVRDHLVKGMLEVPDPAELVVIRDSLSSYMVSRADTLWKQLDVQTITENQRLRLLAALAAFDAKNPKWNQIGDTILKPWLSDQPLYLGTWTDALRPVSSQLIPSVEKVYRGELLPELKYVAAELLADYAKEQPQVLATLIQIADDRQFKTLFPILEKHKARAIELLRKEVAKLPPKDNFPEDESIAKWKSDWTQEEHEAFAKKRSGAAVSLLRLGDAESVWPVLQSSPYPESRTRTIHRFASTSNDPKVLIERLKVEKDLGIRRALILSLGEYREEQIAPELRQPVIDLLLQWYREDPDSGIHGAIDWLLRPEKEGLQDRPLKWGQREKLEAIDREMTETARRQKISAILSLFSPVSDPLAGSRLLLPPPSPKPGSWWVNGQGQTFAVVESREPWVMSSPVDERERRADETLHWRKIDRKFGMMTKAVTVAEFQRFLKANPQIRWRYANEFKHYAPDPDCPMSIVSWWEAAQYCRWLSEQEGLPEWEMVYSSITEIEHGKNEEKPLVLPANHLSRKGYRLPTEAEWEYLARRGSRTSYFFGSDLELLPRHSWYVSNSKNRCWPVGQKQPNDWGLFDLSGNTYAWCQEAGLLWKARTLERPLSDVEENRSITLEQGIMDELLRSLRGGSFGNRSNEVRSSVRSVDRPSNRNSSIGLRLCRTFD